MAGYILTDDDYFDLIDDTDADSPPCGEHCPCPLCQASDRDEQRVLERLEKYCSLPAVRPSVEGERAA